MPKMEKLEIRWCGKTIEIPLGGTASSAVTVGGGGETDRAAGGDEESSSKERESIGCEESPSELSKDNSVVLDGADLMGTIETFADLKAAIFRKTQVREANQKIMGLKLKDGKKLVDSSLIQDLDIKTTTKIMMMGQPDKNIEEYIKVEEQERLSQNEIKDDLTDELSPDDKDAIKLREIFQQKIDKRIQSYEIEMKHPVREGKKLVVLDIDYTIYDHKSSAERIEELMRPYLHEFLGKIYPFYDIAIWSATGMKWIDAKCQEMGLFDSNKFKIAFCLDSLAMIDIHTEQLGLRSVAENEWSYVSTRDISMEFIQAKPLAVIWGIVKGTKPENTIMFDDTSTNFFMNPKNGLKIRPYRNCHQNRDTDRELLDLSRYLIKIAEKESDFTKINHRRWERYLEKQDDKEERQRNKAGNQSSSSPRDAKIPKPDGDDRKT